jgi:hypothetical protein
MASKFPRRACSERLKTFFVIIKVFFPIIKYAFNWQSQKQNAVKNAVQNAA